MSDQDKKVAADLYELLEVANEFLPVLSGVYTKVISDTATARGSLESVLQRPSYFGDAAGGPVYRAWATLAADMTKIFGDTVASFGHTRTALLLAVKEFEVADTGAAVALRSLISYDGNPNPGMAEH
jgi:hypothetical protein